MMIVISFLTMLKGAIIISAISLDTVSLLPNVCGIYRTLTKLMLAWPHIKNMH